MVMLENKKKDGLHSLEHHRQQLTPITCVMNYKKRQIQFQKKNAVEPSQKNVNTTETTRAGGSIGPCYATPPPIYKDNVHLQSAREYDEGHEEISALVVLNICGGVYLFCC